MSDSTHKVVSAGWFSISQSVCRLYFKQDCCNTAAYLSSPKVSNVGRVPHDHWKKKKINRTHPAMHVRCPVLTDPVSL